MIVISATISAPADTISLSAHTLIVFSNAIRISTPSFITSIYLLQKKKKKSSEDSEDFFSFFWRRCVDVIKEGVDILIAFENTIRI